jgi:predicted Zn finger-like uncharacterized protein
MRENPMAQQMLSCPACQGVFQIEESQRGLTLRCQRCQHTFETPGPVSGTPWYVARDKVKLGPFSSAQLKELAKTGQLWPEDMVLKEGERKWVAASAIKGLFTMAPKTSPATKAAAPAPAPKKPNQPEPEPESENVFADMTSPTPRGRDQRTARSDKGDGDRPRRRDERPPAKKKGSGSKVLLFVLLGVAVGCTGLCGGGGYWAYTWFQKKAEEARKRTNEWEEELNKLNAGSGEDTKIYSINLRSHPRKGKSALIHETDKQKGTIKFFDAQNKPTQEVKMDESKEIACRETVIEDGDGRPRIYKETYENAVATKDGKPRAEAYKGRTMVFEWKDGKYQMKPASGPAPTGKDRDSLSERPAKHEFDAGLMPGKDVKVGDTWKIPAEALAKAFAPSGELDMEQSKGEAKLTRVYDREGDQWGAIEFTLNLKYKGAQGMRFDPPATADFKGTLDTPLHGTSTARRMTYTGPFKVKTKIGQGKMAQTMELDTMVTVTETRDFEIDAKPDANK